MLLLILIDSILYLLHEILGRPVIALMLSIHSALDCIGHLLDAIFYLWLQIFQLTGSPSHFVECLYFVCVRELYRQHWSFINKALMFIRVFQSGAICSLVF